MSMNINTNRIVRRGLTNVNSAKPTTAPAPEENEAVAEFADAVVEEEETTIEVNSGDDEVEEISEPASEEVEKAPAPRKVAKTTSKNLQIPTKKEKKAGTIILGRKAAAPKAERVFDDGARYPRENFFKDVHRKMLDRVPAFKEANLTLAAATQIAELVESCFEETVWKYSFKFGGFSFRRRIVDPTHSKPKDVFYWKSERIQISMKAADGPFTAAVAKIVNGKFVIGADLDDHGNVIPDAEIDALARPYFAQKAKEAMAKKENEANKLANKEANDAALSKALA